MRSGDASAAGLSIAGSGECFAEPLDAPRVPLLVALGAMTLSAPFAAEVGLGLLRRVRGGG